MIILILDIKEIVIGPCNDRPGSIKLGNNQSINRQEAEALETTYEVWINSVEFALIKRRSNRKLEEI